MIRNKALSMIVCSTLFGLIAFSRAPSGKNTSMWTNPPAKKELSNGLTFIYQKDESSEITVLYLFIRGGKRVEPQEKRGLSYLTTRLAIEIPDQKKAQDLMSQASRVSMSSKGDYSFIRIACLSESLEDTLKTMFKIITDPLFSGIRINYIKETMENRKKREEDDALLLAHEAYVKTFLADKGYGGSVLGSEESHKKIKKEDIENFYKTHFQPPNMILVVCSDLEEERILNICSDYFGKFPKGTPPPLEAGSAAVETEKEIFIEKESKQAVVSFGYPLLSLSKRNFALTYLLETLLGRGIGSRLWPLRTEEKLAYNVGSRTTQLKYGGVLEAFLETDNEKQKEALEALRKTIEDLYKDGVTEEELKVTKIQSKASFLRMNETKERRALNLGLFEVQGLGFEFVSSFSQEIEAITLGEMNAFIKETLDPEKRIQIVVGPRAESTDRENS